MTCGSIRCSCCKAKVSPEMHSIWLRTDPAYKKLFKEVQRQTAEDEAVRRACEGVRKPVWYRGKIVSYKIEYSDRLLIALLKAYNPEKFGDHNVQVEWDGDLNKLTEEQMKKMFKSIDAARAAKRNVQ